MQDKASAVIIATDASSQRPGREKLWTPLLGRIVLARTIDVFVTSPVIETIVLVVSAARYPDMQALCQHESWHKIASIVVGGPRRQDAVRSSLDTLAQVFPSCRWIMIHDGARPLVAPSMLEAGLQAVQKHQAVTAAVPVKETVKLVYQDQIRGTLDRSQLWTMQTPQVFSFPLIYQAHHTPQAQEDVIDDAMLLQRLGYAVHIFPGSYNNIKITTQDDLLLAEELLQGYLL